MLLTRTAGVADRCWSYCNQGRKRDGGWFDHYTLGSNYRITGFQAAVLNVQLRRLPEQTERRARNLAYFYEGLRAIGGFVPLDEDSRIEQHPNYLLPFWYKPEAFSGLPRDLAIKALQAEGIPFKIAYPHPLYRNPLFTGDRATWSPSSNQHAQDYAKLHLPVAERACRECLWLNHDVFLGETRDVDDVLEALRRVQRMASTLTSSVAERA